jgi:hypothetical protein
MKTDEIEKTVACISIYTGIHLTAQEVLNMKFSAMQVCAPTFESI